MNNPAPGARDTLLAKRAQHDSIGKLSSSSHNNSLMLSTMPCLQWCSFG